MPSADPDILTRMLFAVDALDWDGVRASFADTVRVDYTELFGGAASEVTVDELVAGWRASLPGFDATQHLNGPCIVSGDVVQTHVRAVHRIAGAEGGELWSVYGHYVARLVEGRIAALTLRLLFQDGNTALPELAAQRATSAPRASRTFA